MNVRKIKKIFKVLWQGIYNTHDELILFIKLNEVNKFSYEDSVHIENVERNKTEQLVEFYAKYDLGGRNPATVVDRCFELNHKCYTATQDGKIMGYVWWGDKNLVFDRHDPDEKYLDDGVIKLSNGEIYVFFVFVALEFRTHNTAIKFMLSFTEKLIEAGYSKLYSYVAANNLPAFYIFKLLGSETKERIAVHRVFLFFLFKNKRFYLDRNGHKEFISSLKKMLKKKKKRINRAEVETSN
jgi:hypothetical protein